MTRHIPRYSRRVTQEYSGEVKRHPNPWRPSIVDLWMCPTCREYALEGSKALGYCTRCGTKHSHAA